MLILTVHNDGTGDSVTGHYDIEVLVTERSVDGVRTRRLAQGRLRDFPRDDGWRDLLLRSIAVVREVGHVRF